MIHPRFVCASVLVIVLLGTACYGQTENATISGRVTDSSGAIIGGASVTLQSADRGTSLETTTNRSGIYVFSSVQPGVYYLTVRKEGFKTESDIGLTANVQDHLEQNFRLSIGAVSESVTVTAETTNINTSDASVSTIVDQSYIKNMPLNGRSFQDLILLTPGVTTVSAQLADQEAAPAAGNGQTGEFSVNGQRTESNVYTVDGVSANVGATSGTPMFAGAGASGSVAAATSLGTTQALVPVDDLQEFRVESSTYSAEFGRNPGGQFIFETKSGTQQWHGTAFDYLRNSIFDATDWFTGFFGLKQAALRQNDFGGTLGGPVIPGRKSKTFFFASYEGLRLVTPQPAAMEDVPDNALRVAAPAPLNQVLNAWPLQSPNAPDDVANGMSSFFGSWSNSSNIDSGNVRLDQVVNDKLRLFFRFSDTSSNSLARGAAFTRSSPPSQSVLSDYTMRTYTGGATSVFSSRLNNDFRINYTSNETTNNEFLTAFGGSTPVDLQQLAGYGSGSHVRVTLDPPLYHTDLSQGPESGKQRQWNLVDTFGVSSGRHQFKFGGDYRRLTPIAIQSNPFVDYEFNQAYPTMNSNVSVATNITDRAGPVFQGPAYPLYQNFSAFGQDEWRVSSRLTLSMGLRWEVDPAPGVTQGPGPFTVLPDGAGNYNLQPQGTPLWKTTWYNFAPRLGAAFLLRTAPGWETVLRGGGGVFFDTGQQIGSAGFQGPGFISFNTVFNSSPFPGSIPVAPITNSLNDCFCAWGFSPHLQLPYTLEWNGSIEQALGSSQAFTLSYVGSHASRPLQTNGTFDNNGDTIVLGQNGLTSDYDSLQTQFQRRLSRGLTALGSYTWSHCLDYGSSNILVAYRRGNCDMDIRHNFTAAFSYDLPKVEHSGLMGAVLSNWGIDDRFLSRTGFPVVLNGSPAVIPNTLQFFYSGVDLVQGQPLYVTQCITPFNTGSTIPCPGGRGINPNAFIPVPPDPNFGFPTRNGTAPRNFLRGFGAWQMNLGVRREFALYEQLKLQFRAEAFNIFNHPNFGSVNSLLGTRTFGEATQTLATSLGTNSALSSQYQMGGPRSMQFALRLVF